MVYKGLVVKEKCLTHTNMHVCIKIDVPTVVSVMEYRVWSVEIHSGESRSVMVCLG